MDVPPRMMHLPRSGGMPVPWFVAWVDGKPDFRVARDHAIVEALRFDKCWVCGETLGRYKSFVVGPAATITRMTSEPACHRECALYAALTCPFLVNPQKDRRYTRLPDGAHHPPGEMVQRNPGAVVVWTCTHYDPVRVGKGVLLMLGPPTRVEWFTEGRVATNDETLHAVHTSAEVLRESAAREGDDAVEELDRMVTIAERTCR